MMATYLVTGAAGFIGSNLVDSLLAAGHSVDGVDDLSTGSMENVTNHPDYCFHECDCTSWKGTDHGWDAIFHCAARARIQPSFSAPVETVGGNFLITLKMLELARRVGARFVYAGSSTCDGDTFANPYTLSKHACEDLCELYSRVYDVPCATARFYNVYGPRQIEEGPYATAMGIWEKATREGRPLVMCGNGTKRRDWTHISDIVAGLIAIDGWMSLSSRRYSRFHLGTGQNVSVAEILAMFGGPVEYRPDRPGEAQVSLARNGVTMTTLGWRPKWRIEDYIQQEVLCSKG